MTAILHIDMDAFYASVEQRDAPELRGRPVIVGGDARRGVVLAASCEARPLGLKSAMPMAKALRLAPQVVVVPPRFAAYAEASSAVFNIFESVTPLIEPLSLDEAFLDVTASTRLFGSPAEIARHLRGRIAKELLLPASAGIAEVKFVAKIASDLAKPNGQKEVPEGGAAEFLAPLPVSRLFGVGPKTEATLLGLGLATLGDIARSELSWLDHVLGESGRRLYELSRGIDPRVVIPDREAKSIGAEDTFGEDTAEEEALSAHLHSQALRVGRRLRRSGRLAKVMLLKLKFSDFQLLTRRCTLSEPTDDGQVIFAKVLELLRKEQPLSRKVRLTGVAAHQLSEVQGQLPMFTTSRRAERLNQTLDRIAERFGPSSMMPADLVALEPESEGLEEARRRVGGSRLDAAVASRTKKKGP